jgi:hypothetical protein
MAAMDTSDYRVGKITKRRFKEILEALVGTEVELIHSYRGPTSKTRTVHEVRSNDVVFEINGKYSYLNHEPYESYYELFGGETEDDRTFNLAVGDEHGINVAYRLPDTQKVRELFHQQ